MSKVVLITGANRGIGLGLTQRYLQIGYQVIATCRSPDSAIDLLNLKSLYSQLIVEKLDVCNLNDFKELSARYASKIIDILINNAGIFPEAHSKTGLANVDPQQILEAFQTNAIGALAAIQTFQKNLLLSDNPKVINISSQMGALSSANGFCYSYRMSKVALNMLTRCFAAENNQIITIALRPGWVKTKMGGTNATISIEESVIKMIKVIDTLQPQDSGLFMDNEKKFCKW